MRPRDNHSNNPELTLTYKGCPRMMNLNKECQVCNNFNTRDQSDGFEVVLKVEYNSWIQKKSPSEKLVPIAGNLEDFGWEVYNRVNIRYVNIVENLFNDLRSMVSFSCQESID